eukprot:SAG11_NODE_2216_length_3680_cov_1.815415_1_plen_341_part_00
MTAVDIASRHRHRGDARISACDGSLFLFESTAMSNSLWNNEIGKHIDLTLWDDALDAGERGGRRYFDGSSSGEGEAEVKADAEAAAECGDTGEGHGFASGSMWQPSWQLWVSDSTDLEPDGGDWEKGVAASSDDSSVHSDSDSYTESGSYTESLTSSHSTDWSSVPSLVEARAWGWPSPDDQADGPQTSFQVASPTPFSSTSAIVLPTIQNSSKACEQSAVGVRKSGSEAAGAMGGSTASSVVPCIVNRAIAGGAQHHTTAHERSQGRVSVATVDVRWLLKEAALRRLDWREYEQLIVDDTLKYATRPSIILAPSNIRIFRETGVAGRRRAGRNGEMMDR